VALKNSGLGPLCLFAGSVHRCNVVPVFKSDRSPDRSASNRAGRAGTPGFEAQRGPTVRLPVDQVPGQVPVSVQDFPTLRPPPGCPRWSPCRRERRLGQNPELQVDPRSAASPCRPGVAFQIGERSVDRHAPVDGGAKSSARGE